LVWGAYVAIPFVLLYYARHRKNLPFKHLFWLFGLFIAACGATHLMAYVTTITPVYRLDALIKVVTALASWGTVVAIAFIAPRALSMRMPEDLEAEIQERERVEGDLVLMNASLQERTSQLEEAIAELEGFNYLVSHDLRAPLRGIIANSSMVLEDAPEALDEESRQRLQRLGGAALRMSHLVDDLLAFSRLGRHEVTRLSVNASVIAAGVAEELLAEYAVRFDIDDGVEVHADPHLLRLVLQNLMQNAAKYASPEREPFVRFGVADTDEGRALFVEDNGMGFDMTYAVKIFLPFERLHQDERIPGTGIGLANVKRIVERHGGRVWAHSQPGAGATFYFTLGPDTFADPAQSTDTHGEAPVA
jgi:signal transduction histidine kinase